MSSRWLMTDSTKRYLDGLARSLKVAGMDELAVELGFENAQDMADRNGFVNIYAYFSAPGNAERYIEIECVLIEKRKGAEVVPI
ncbi:MAG: hypothetical protein G01um101420_707 [Parcubacteria group bacterium Gr01-1014_20]|nr:MAG: hypothetical protein G01um101420_707 [Parcubacteria group bacterium Gr01-1014_20]